MKYIVEIYCGRAYCGNAFCETYEECWDFAVNDVFCDKVKITDLETGSVEIAKIER